jgi:pantetheine-phosphate adenylyltransferase
LLDKLSSKENLELSLSIIFHDIIYNPKVSDNEYKSAEFFKKICSENNIGKDFDINVVYNLILDTKHHDLNKASNDLSKQLIMADLSILSSNLDDLIEYENKIFKEYQFVDYNTYKEKRIEFLKNANVQNYNIADLIKYIEIRKIKIGLYPGSFNPFHKGHLNILEKSEKIFDKVIIAYGNNPNKTYNERIIPNEISNREIIFFDKMLTDLISSLPYDITIIRGLRNSTDFQFELNQYRFLQELDKNINVISIFCDKDYEHISSSSLKILDFYGKEHKYNIY